MALHQLSLLACYPHFHCSVVQKGTIYLKIKACVENYIKILNLFKIQTKIRVDKCVAVDIDYNLVYIPQYENAVCLGTNCISRLCFASRVEVWYFGDSLATSFSR